MGSDGRRAPVGPAFTMAAGAAVIWFVHLAVSYALVPPSCRWESAIPLLVVTVTAVAIGAGSAVAVARAWKSPRSWGDRWAAALRTGTSDEDGATDLSATRAATTGLALAGYFTFIMLLAALVPILVDPCA